MKAIAVVNDGVAFFVELALLVAVGLGGLRAPVPHWLNLALALALPLLVTALWAFFAAPNSGTRLVMPWLLLFKVALFGTGTAALYYWAGLPIWATVFGVVATGHVVIATVNGNL